MVKKALTAFILIVSFLVMFICAANATGGDYYDLTWELDDEGVLTISGSGDMKGFLADSTDAWRPYELEITKVVINNGVTSVGRYAFDGCNFLTSVSIPDTVTKIGMCSFSECTDLTNIVIPDSVMEIGSSAFYKCRNLNSIVLPSGLTLIDDNTFTICENLVNIRIPESVTKIKGQAFSGCKKLASIDFPEGLTEIEYEAFVVCNDLKNISLPESLKKIGDHAFYKCEKIQHVFYGGTESESEKIVLGENNNTLQSAMWHYEVNESNTIHLPAGISVLEQNSLENTSASVYIIPEGTTSLLSGSLSNLTHVAKIYLPSSLKHIDDNAFRGSENALLICPNSTCYSYQWAYGKGLNVITE